jgi:arsenate reductase
MPITIYHNPRCTKSRQTLALLQEKGIEPVVIEYLNFPPDAQTLQTLLDKLQLTARQLMRTKETAYKEANLSNPQLNEAELITAMIEQPILIERPIVVNGDKAAIGRPPENVLAIL